jgi:hypothetical protein
MSFENWCGRDRRVIIIFSFTDRSGKYNIKLCEESYRLLKDFVRTRNFKKLVDIIKENMLLESITVFVLE